MAEPRLHRSRRCLRSVAATVLVAGLGLTASACGGDADAQGGGMTAVTLTSPYTVPDVTLTDTGGQPFDVATDATHPLSIVFFGYTHCADICPMVLTNLASAMTRLDDADRQRVQVLFLTSDPTRDTPAVMGRYVDRFDPDFVGLTGSFDQMNAVARPLAVGLDKINAGMHTTTTLAVTGDQAVAYWDDDTTAAEFAADIHTLLTDGTVTDAAGSAGATS